MARALKSLRLTAGLAIVPFAAFFSAAPALAATAPSLGSAGGYAALAGSAVTCTDSTVNGDVGVALTAAFTNTSCAINGTVHAGDGVALQAYNDFLSAYAALAATRCTQNVVDTTFTGVTLTFKPGVICFDAAATFTNVTLILDGPATALWIFKIGTGGTGALTGTGLSVVTASGVPTCNVLWWTAEAATMTDSQFVGTILAGTSITVTGGTFHGDALAKVAVTLTSTTISSCGPSSGSSTHPKCNQGVGNGPEGCDPGNSNQGDKSRSNDELGGTPGNPGRKGGNGK